MTERRLKIFLFLKDFLNAGSDRYFLADEEGLHEVTAHQVVEQQVILICHDYWLIAPALFESSGSLPLNVIDLDDFHVATSCSKSVRKKRDKMDITRRLADAEGDSTLARNYFSIFNRSSSFDISVYESIVPVLMRYWNTLESGAKERGELDRFFTVEMPVSHYLVKSAAAGIAIDVDKLREYKLTVERDYYLALKAFSDRYSLPLEVPDDEDIIEYLEPRGFDFSGVDVDYVLQFVPMQSNFAIDVIHLRKLSRSRNILAAIPSSKRRIFPFVDSFGSITSRIYYRDPSLQNLAKRHRDVLEPDNGKVFSYVDYGQYEAGIMAALSGDEALLYLYSQPDMYEALAVSIFGDAGKRKAAKRLFLSYAYGMGNQGLLAAAVGFGAERSKARAFFKQFATFEEWKAKICASFLTNGRVGTTFGNYLAREPSKMLSMKEQRSAISQVVQGTASLIFKNALLELSRESEVQLRLPMHDAVLVQHPVGYAVDRLPKLFVDVMTKHFSERIVGKASLDEFFSKNAT